MPGLSTLASVAINTGDVVGFEVVEASLDDRPMMLALADTADRRGRGLMEVRDLGELDGMLFVFDAEVEVAFTMRNTLIPLDIAFFDREGRIVDRLEMVPCNESPCPLYRAADAFAYAVEMPSGTMGETRPASILKLDL